MMCVFQKRIEQFLIPLFDMRDEELIQVSIVFIFEKNSFIGIHFGRQELFDV